MSKYSRKARQKRVVTMITPEAQDTLRRMYKDLGWGAERQIGFCQRQCRRSRPCTTDDYNQVYHGLEEILKRLVRPHYDAFTRLVQTLYGLRSDMTPWERNFLGDIHQKRNRRAEISAAMIKKTREIAHKYQIECGFPSFRALAAAWNDQPEHAEQR